jgi:hypothetical protein
VAPAILLPSVFSALQTGALFPVCEINCRKEISQADFYFRQLSAGYRKGEKGM